jgi:hypothetical protein
MSNQRTPGVCLNFEIMRRVVRDDLVKKFYLSDFIFCSPILEIFIPKDEFFFYIFRTVIICGP